MRLLLSATVVLALASCAHAVAALPSIPREATLVRIDGQAIQLDQWKGKVVLLDVWATWCEPCRKSLPFYRSLSAELADRGLVVVGLNVDDDEAAMRRMLSADPLPFTVVRDPIGGLISKLDVAQMPTAFLIDRSGSIRLRHEGFRAGDEATVRQEVERLLGEPR